MDLWVGHAKRKRTCINCTKPINPGDEVINGQWKRTYPWGTRTRRVISHWSCWFMLQRIYFDEHPYIPSGVGGSSNNAGPGRPPKYTKEERLERTRLQVNIYRWVKQREGYIGKNMWAVADGYGDRIKVARDRLNVM